jgi:hypothetical protein
MPASNERMQALSHVIEQSAQDNPQLAVEFLDLMPLGHLHQSTSRSIAETWLKQDPGAAMEWILGLPAQTQANLLQMLSWSVVQQDPELAMSLLPEIQVPAVRQQWASAIAQRLGQSDPERAERWVRSLEDEPYSGELLTSVAVSLAQRDVPAAMELATDIGDTDQRNSAVIQIVDQWVTQDVEAAAAYVRSQQDADLQMNLVGAVLRQWNTFDPVAARKWVMAFDDPLVRDQGLASTILSPYTSEAEAAATLALISSDELRYSAISNYVHNLARYDTTSARAFLSRYSLPDEQMAPLLDYIDSIEQGF